MAINTKLTRLSPARDNLKVMAPLVSGGYSVKDALPGGKVTVFPWDVSVSEWLASQANAATTELETTVELVKKVSRLNDEVLRRLPEGELAMILMVSRALAFREQKVIFSAVCPHCGTLNTDLSVKIPDDLEVVAGKTSEYEGFEPPVTLPVTGDDVSLRPLLVGDLLDIDTAGKTFDPLAVNLPEPVKRVAAAIVSVGGGKPDNHKEAANYVNALHPQDVEFLISHLDKCSPALSQTIKIKCKREDCAKVFSHTLNLRRDFFRRPGE